MRLIDADAKELVNRININFGGVTRFVVKSILKDAPTIDAVPVVHGQWVAETERMGNYSHCSECGIRCQGYVPNYNYCPNCGAKMDGEVDG